MPIRVVDGEHLSTIVHGVYKNPRYYMAVAGANQLDTVRTVEPGRALYLPPVG